VPAGSPVSGDTKTLRGSIKTRESLMPTFDSNGVAINYIDEG